MLANVTFPSGQLLVADAISVGGMWDKVRDLLRRNHLDVCYPWHRMEGTMLALAQMHYVNIHGTSDGPGLVQSLDTGHLFGAPATDGFSNVANVCHDYWGTSIVDQEHVISAMVQAGATRQEALTAIAGWETESPHHTRIAVTPGTWCVLWDEDGESVEKALATSGINHPKGTTFALFPTPPAFPFGSVVNLTA